jgi:methyltransferase (TIGR00027 family)
MRRSWTAQGAAAQRAVLTDRSILDDPFARTMLSPSMKVLSWLVARGPRSLFEKSITLAGAAGSDLWFDQAVNAALDGGAPQVAIIGAGYDSRAWRLARPSVRFFELDHAASQEAKRRVAPGAGPTYVTADLRTESAAAALVAQGLDPDRPVVIVFESVVMYLTDEVVRWQFSELAGFAAGSRLLVNFLPSSPPETTRTKRQLRLQKLVRLGGSEGLTFGADPSEAAALVVDAGWTIVEQVSFRQAAQLLVPPGTGLPIDAIDERKTLIAADR